MSPVWLLFSIIGASMLGGLLAILIPEAMMMKKRVSICLDEDLLKEIDLLRGMVPRSALIEALLRIALQQLPDELYLQDLEVEAEAWKPRLERLRSSRRPRR